MHNNNVSDMIHGLESSGRHVNHDKLKLPLVDQQQFVYCTTIIAIIIGSRTATYRKPFGGPADPVKNLDPIPTGFWPKGGAARAAAH